MTTPPRVLLAGESWMSQSTHVKGWDFFSSADYQTGVEHLERALLESGIDFTHLPNHEAAAKFPLTRDELDRYDVVILSDIGANTLLLHPDTFLHGARRPNRLRLLAEWVRDGGSLAMCGGYYSFQGIYGASRYRSTPIEEILPIDMLSIDDRIEIPEGSTPELLLRDHPIVANLDDEWPYLLGCNEVMAKPDAQVIAMVQGHPLLVVREVGQGRTLAWTSDIGPHWCPLEFVSWSGYALLWQQAVQWLAAPRLVARELRAEMKQQSH